MKKLLLVLVLLLTLTLVGCGDDGNYWQSEDYYTQSQVDELIQNAIDELGEEIEHELWLALNDRYVQMEIGDNNLYFHCTVDGMIKDCKSVNYQEQIDELELIIDNLEEIIFENQRRLDEGNTELDIEIMYGEMTGVEASMDGDPNNNYVLVTVKGVEYKTFHISDEPVYWYSKMIVIRIGDVYLSYVNKK